ncbi:MAG: 16S rRNA (guanine(966)-N(2))-methyltransferase RsmD [Woeseiaceae bacterium]
MMAKRNKSNKTRSGRLRIVAGNWRSRLLDIADVPGLRPTPERIRETLFNWLAPHIHGARCLDLFAGTGALGLEALSRGAKSTVFVDSSERAIDTLKVNIGLLGAEGAEVRPMDAAKFLNGQLAQQFDLVFIDPPFASDLLDDTFEALEASGALTDRCLIYVEQSRTGPESSLPNAWRILKDKTAGNVRYMLVQREA